MRKLAILLAPLFLAGCLGRSTPSAVETPELARIGVALKLPCDGVVDIPDKALGEREASELWARDRVNLGDCKARHAALAAASGAIEGQGVK